LYLKYNISEGKTELQAYEPTQLRRFCIHSSGIGTEWSDEIESFCTLEALNTSFSASGRNSAVPKYEPCHTTNNYATNSGNKDIANNHPFHPYYKPFPMGNADRRRRKNNKKLHIRGEIFVERGAISAN
jgi:hypothetical protein